ncbi:septum site-determining protein MinC [Terrihabitans soli]|nr:septum site-determining protein MinC [Terrihabitans soli]
MRLIGRSYMAFALTPEAPVADWLADLDVRLARAPEFFADRAVVLDLTSVRLSRAGIEHLVAGLLERKVRVMGLEGVDPSKLGPSLPPLLHGGRAAAAAEIVKKTGPAEKPAPSSPRPTSLLLNEPVRSGQSIVFPEGDISVLGSVASGAEIVAGGSIHIYGTLRGRAMAGSLGNNPDARIFCQKIEAELLAIGGYYRTADEIDDTLRGGAMQAWLDGTELKITALQ